MTIRIDRDIPSWLYSLQQHHFEALAAAAGAAQAYGPILAVIARHDETPERQSLGQHVAFDDNQ